MNIAELVAILRLKPDKASFEAADRLIGHAARGLSLLAGFFAVDYVKGFVDQVVQTGDQIDEMSQKFGVSVESLQELGYAASFSGLGLSDVGQGLKFLGKNADAAKRGSKDVAKAFREAGLDAKKIANGTMLADEALVQVADKFAEMPDGLKKSNLAMKLFGRQGQNLIPFLNEGSEGIQRLRDEAIELGIVLSEDDAKAMAEFADEQDKLKAEFQGIKTTIARLLVPQFKKIVVAIRAWFKENRKLIAQRIAQAFQILGRVLTVVGKALSMFFEVISDHSDIAVAAIVALIGALVALRFASIAAAAASAVAWIAANLPIVAIALAVLALILIVEDLYQAFAGGRSVFKDLYDAAVEWLGESTLGRVFLDTIDAWKESLQIVFDILKTDIERVKIIVDDLVERFVKAKEIVEDILDILPDVGGDDSNLFSRGLQSDQPPWWAKTETAQPLADAAAISATMAPESSGGRGIFAPAMDMMSAGTQKIINDGRRISLNLTVNGGDPKEVRRVVEEVLEEEFAHAESAEDVTP